MLWCAGPAATVTALGDGVSCIVLIFDPTIGRSLTCGCGPCCPHLPNKNRRRGALSIPSALTGTGFFSSSPMMVQTLVYRYTGHAVPRQPNEDCGVISSALVATTIATDACLVEV